MIPPQRVNKREHNPLGLRRRDDHAGLGDKGIVVGSVGVLNLEFETRGGAPLRREIDFKRLELLSLCPKAPTLNAAHAHHDVHTITHCGERDLGWDDRGGEAQDPAYRDVDLPGDLGWRSQQNPRAGGSAHLNRAADALGSVGAPRPARIKLHLPSLSLRPTYEVLPGLRARSVRSHSNGQAFGRKCPRVRHAALRRENELLTLSTHVHARRHAAEKHHPRPYR